MKRLVAIAVAILVGLAFLAGYLPERQRRLVLERQLASLRTDLAEAQIQVLLAGLLSQLLAVEDAVSSQNYGEAQTLSSKLFDDVRAEAAGIPDPSSKDTLEKVIRMRDRITASLTRGDPQIQALLREAEMHLRSGLGSRRIVAP
ncbi:MAG: hypothetical protein HYX75_18505 [Acidobacteria bacterium]|nr:hypothetical protein [Acidobacteriota bacterium]